MYSRVFMMTETVSGASLAVHWKDKSLISSGKNRARLQGNKHGPLQVDGRDCQYPRCLGAVQAEGCLSMRLAEMAIFGIAKYKQVSTPDSSPQSNSALRRFTKIK